MAIVIVIYLIIGLVWMLINEAVSNWLGFALPHKRTAISIAMYILAGILWPIHIALSIWAVKTQPDISDEAQEAVAKKLNEKKD